MTILSDLSDSDRKEEESSSFVLLLLWRSDFG